MRDLLVTDYALEIRDTTTIGQRECYCDDNYAYFTICMQDREVLYMEQALLACFLKENGCRGVAWPIRNAQGDWYTRYQNQHYLVLRTEVEQFSDNPSSGELLAHFHMRFSHYPYEPKYVSCYGKWKDLWTEKLDYFEDAISQMVKHPHHPYAHRLMDIFSYVIGMAENAIQYVRECEMENRFGETDQAAITFVRFSNQLQQPVIWPDALMHDHPTRDLAEWIRVKFLQRGTDAIGEVEVFLADYEAVRPLSVFGWRLLYARLLFPAHFFDVLEGLLAEEAREEQEAYLDELDYLCSRQGEYEKRLGRFFEMADVDSDQFQIPVLDWLAT